MARGTSPGGVRSVAVTSGSWPQPALARAAGAGRLVVVGEAAAGAAVVAGDVPAGAGVTAAGADVTAGAPARVVPAPAPPPVPPSEQPPSAMATLRPSAVHRAARLPVREPEGT